MIGTILDKYEVLQKVGEGGMATVYRGRHTTLDRDVAIKVLHPHLSSSTRNRKRFAREARAIEHLRHQNILEIFDYSGTDCSECYIITEFVEGETLAALMQRVGRLPSEVAAMIGERLANALDYAHRAGILHRDLKPDNVMIRCDGTVKLMDFGIARFLDESQVTMTGALVGSPAFMSPEQAREGELDARSDLFSLGTLLFHLVTGHLPFSGSNASLILKNIIEGNRPQVAELAPTASAKLCDVIEQLMQQDREDRQSSASRVAEELRQCLEEVGFDASTAGFTLTDYLTDPDGTLRRLDAWLRPTLLATGKGLLAAGDHLSALRLFNRLLSMDEDNAEVLEFVQGLHAEPAPRRNALPIVLAVGVFAILGVISAIWMAPSEEPAPEPIAVVAPAPAPAPIAAPEPEIAAAPVVPEPPTLVSPVVARTALSPGDLRRPAPAITPPLPEFGWLELRSSRFPVDIYEGSSKLGDVRQTDRIRMPAGEHTLVLRHDLTEDYPLTITIMPGETLRHTVNDIQPRVVYVPVAQEFAGECEAEVNGVSIGSLTALDRRIPLRRPDRENTVGLTCPNGTFRRAFAPGTGGAGFLKEPSPP